jgi:hypothetical protein
MNAVIDRLLWPLKQALWPYYQVRSLLRQLRIGKG